MAGLVARRSLIDSSHYNRYQVRGYSPKTVADFAGEIGGQEEYRIDGAITDFDTMFTYTGASSKTMTDSDGNLKWAPHNLALNSASPATQSITVISGADYTVEITGTGSVALSNAGSGTVTAGSPVEITASTTTLTLTVTGSPTTMWCYRSDLGGMVDNPNTSSSYVPTTGSAVYLPRRNSYRYNGSSYVNKGITVESAAATNLVTYSQDFDDTSTSYWTNTNTTALSADATGPDGQTSATTIQDDSGTGTGTVEVVTGSITVSTSTAYTASVYAKADGLSWLALGTQNFTTPGDVYSYFNLSTGATGTAGSGHSLLIEDVGGGWYRCAITFTTDGTDTTGNIAIGVADADTDNTVDRDGTSSILAYGAMLEAGSVPTSIIPTSGATATRAAEALTIAGANMAASTTAMSFQWNGEENYVDGNSAGQTGHWDWIADANNYIRTYPDTDRGTGGLTAAINTAGVFRGTESNGSDRSPGVNVSYNYGFRVVDGGANVTTQVAFEGTAVTAVTNSNPANIATLSSSPFNFGIAGSTSYSGTYSLLRQWDVNIGEAGIEEAKS